MYETFFRHYIVVDGRRVANHVRYRFYTPGYSHTTQWTAYATSDHLSSMDSIYDMEAVPPSTTPQARYSNDAFGKRRDRDWDGPPTQDDLTAAWFDFSNRGFTDHEHLDGVGGLIHMNGRVCDPVIARFMSADPFVQAPYFSQSLNRYSYTFNDPLSHTDPSGFEVFIRGVEGVTTTASRWSSDFGAFGYNAGQRTGRPPGEGGSGGRGRGGRGRDNQGDSEDVPSVSDPDDVTETVTVTGTDPDSPTLTMNIRFDTFVGVLDRLGTEGGPRGKWPVSGKCTLNVADSSRDQGGGRFGDPRSGGRTHEGIDITATAGSPAVAAFSGTIVSVSPNPSASYGYQVVIDIGSNQFLQYAHLNPPSVLYGIPSVVPGGRVSAGDLLGTVGRTGNVPFRADTHLHFEYRLGGPGPFAPVADPLSILPPCE